MKNALLFLVFLPFLLPYPQYTQPLSILELKNKNAISCAPDFNGNFDTTANGKFIIPLPGWGHYSYDISTDIDSAQFYFNQGLNMYYSYHAKEATASFMEAARLDPDCPMAYWGQALAMGPGYNSAHTYSMSKKIPAILQLMNQHIAHASDKEKHLIEVMNRRYSAEKNLDQPYALGLKDLIAVYPEDQDIKALYIDAMMLIHPWDFWYNDGIPKEWTPELVKLCEALLKKNPMHPAGLHYHIHLTEASRHPEVALANATALKTLLPGVAHMVHMSSHEYERNGLYALGVEVNDRADENLIHYDSIAKNISLNKYSPHYFAVQTFCAMSGGMYKTGVQDAQRCRKSVSPTYENTYEQYLYMLPVLTLVRLGKWEEILKNHPQPDEQWPYAGLLHNFATGLAFVYTDQPDSAAQQLIQLRHKIKDPVLTKRRIPFNTTLQSARIAENILDASILFAQKQNNAAISTLKKAISIEDSLIYTEPKDWMIPARQFLGAYLLKLGKPAMAEKVYREDLAWNPGNGWSLLGLCQSLTAQRKKKHLAVYRSKYLASFSHADEVPPGSVYMK
jgi:tetratricopeptide (TPR) repeat protein